MNHTRLTFGDIMQSRILYFDPKIIEACFDICRTLHIDNMPAIDGKHYFELEAGRFKEKEITSDQHLEVDELIFDPTNNLIEKFKKNKHNVLFVFEGEVLRGVVHICDYNQDIVIQAIQDDILVFERNLRQWLILNGYKNENIIDFFRYRIEKYPDKKKHWESRLEYIQNKTMEISVLSEFQLFDFSDLLEFSNSTITNKCFEVRSDSSINGKSSGIKILTDLRNLVMHGKDPVTFISDTEIYSIESLVILFDRLKYFKIQLNKLNLLIRNHSDYIKSIRLDNANKLEIIHDHHPRAIWYFIGR